ncbi:hypothetical protein V502_07163, partial [Pseudogymnoascus sp. VKM F-4520 (FW-2644)]
MRAPSTFAALAAAAGVAAAQVGPATQPA